MRDLSNSSRRVWKSGRSVGAVFVAIGLATAATTALAQTNVRKPANNYPVCTAQAYGSACDPTLGVCAPAPGTNGALVVDGGGAAGAPKSVVLGGEARYASVTVTNCGRIYVKLYNGDRTTSGILKLIAPTISIDATSAVVADGAGYQPNLCRDGDGPNLPTVPATPAGTPTGGQGGCRVLDSAGGGGHFGPGGRGTRDCASSGCVFPGSWEQSCPNPPDQNPGYSTATTEASPASCPSTTSCRASDGRLSDAGPSYYHSVYTLEMGAAGGDAGCRDGDGFDHFAASKGLGVGGPGGGGLALVALNGTQTGSLNIQGYVAARGARGCAWDNDSGGGGAGGTILIVGDSVTVGAAAVISSEGGPGGSGVSTGGGNSWWNACGTSNSTICDDCGGGGGGGIINVQSRSSSLSTSAFFLVDGGPGGGNFDGCTVCQGAAGAGAGEIQIDSAYVGEVCDGYDNDFNGTVDDGFGTDSCGLGDCATTVQQCISGAPQSCAPTVNSDPTCSGSRGTSRPRIAVILDSSGSMLWNLSGNPTFGDGSADHPGIDLDSNGVADDSRLFLAKNALGQLISSYPEIDFAFSRYHQDESVNRSCQTAKWLECEGNCCSYDNPNNQNSASPVACNLAVPKLPSGTVNLTVHDDSTNSNHCINYAGTCGTPRRGADILVGFESDVRQYLRWLDGTETSFNASNTPGNFCAGGDCELRATGPTPLAYSLEALYDYMTPIQTEDPAAACRSYSVILISDGGEDCNGDPASAAAALLARGIKTYVIGVSVDVNEGATLTSIAAAGGTTDYIPVNTQSALLPALVSIVSSSIRVELCNGVDDNCNGQVDEGYNVGAACDNGLKGICLGRGHIACDPSDVHKTICSLDMPGLPSTAETCNGLDDNCDGRVDEGDPGGGVHCGNATPPCVQGLTHCSGGTLVCNGGILPAPEACNGVDDDCDGFIDDNIAPGGPCGSSVGACRPGQFICNGVNGWICSGAIGGSAEVCNGVDDDCNGIVDDDVPDTGGPCSDDQGLALCKPGVVRCTQGALHCSGGVPFHQAGCTCDTDPCATPPSDPSQICPSGSQCIECECRTPCSGGEFPCSGNLACVGGFCVPPLCGTQTCKSNERCENGTCVDPCATANCPDAQICQNGSCVENSCYYVGCPVDQICQLAVCQDDPCVGVSCEADQFCVDGMCRTTCQDVYCAVGTTCHSGTCQKDLCGGKTCTEGRVCADGQCVADPCANVSCGRGRTCSQGTCVDDPCLHVVCPGDPDQVVCENAECVSISALAAPAADNRIVVAGGGGWSCSAVPVGANRSQSAADVSLALLLVLSAASFVRRRRLHTARRTRR